ncbi:uncharacterized protein LOC111025699 [Momordica charantia]|uniref:Uncharacterized protein LOC111025699 n=1 Tax=Momordica charantia TaxID=3673 RepID=A0A6J1DZF0_MOMCH|nr:uncharacterized protein LOC111025699 [Momordica charantia]
MIPPAMASIKTIAETLNFASIPSSCIFSGDGGAVDAAPQGVGDSIPTIDFSLLTTGTPDQRAKVVDQLGKACQDWGFFMRQLVRLDQANGIEALKIIEAQLKTSS